MRDRLQPRARQNPDRFTIYIPEDDQYLLQRLKMEATRRRVSASALIMQAVAEYVERNEL